MDKLIATLRDRVLYGGGIGDLHRDELELLLNSLPRWRPIDEAPIPDTEAVPRYWLYPCMIQDADGVVYAGFARYVDTNARGRSPRVLRWYEGVSQRYAQILKPRYYQPLPQPRKD